MVQARATRQDRLGDATSPEMKLLQTFVALVSRLAFVEQVLTVPGGDGVEIWTIIDAEPPDFQTNSQVYQAELDAMDGEPDARVLFRLINRRDYAETSLDHILPPPDQVAWQRAS